MFRTEGQALHAIIVMRSALWGTVVAFASPSTSFGVYADTLLDKNIVIAIPAGTTLDDALVMWGMASNLSVMVNSASITTKITADIKGNVSARVALAKILRDAGLLYMFDNSEGIVYIFPAGSRNLVRLHNIFYRSEPAKK